MAMMTSRLVMVLLLVVASALLRTDPVSARYLPTRANLDPARRQEIKEILRMLLDMPEEELQRESLPVGAWSLPSGTGSVRSLADMYELRSARNANSNVNNDSGMVASGQRAKRSTLLGPN